MQVNIAYGTDDKYGRYTYLSIFSLLRNSSTCDKITVYYFTIKENKYIPNIKNLEKLFKNFELKTIYLEKEKYKKLMKTNSYINFSTLFRFAVDSLEGIEKIIYIDCDTIINSNINELIIEDLNWNIIWACSDEPTKNTKNQIKTLWIKTWKYFNAWVILIDLKKRKDFQVSEKCINLLSQKSYKFHDQDVLNIILQNKRKHLHWKFNALTWYFSFLRESKYFQYIWFDKQYYLEAIKNPVIIHYAWQSKPWNLINEHPFRDIYDKNLYHAQKFCGYKLTIKEWLILKLHNIEDKIIKYKVRRKLINLLRNFIKKTE